MPPTKGDSLILTPKNWTSFQHYKDRNPPWIKLHKSLLDDRVFMRLPIASKALAPLLWLLASETKDGSFNASIDELEFRLRMSRKDIENGLKPLIENGFFIVASGLLAECLPVAVPETEKRREETEISGDFSKFWNAWPKNDRKQDKKKCESKWKADNLDAEVEKILADVSDKKLTKKWSDGYIEAPLVYLNNRRWEDGVTQEIQEQDQWSTRGGVEKIAASIGIGAWNEMERWDVYVRRVKTSFDGAAK